jgi:Acetyltransferase (GNAT) domain
LTLRRFEVKINVATQSATVTHWQTPRVPLLIEFERMHIDIDSTRNASPVGAPRVLTTEQELATIDAAWTRLRAALPEPTLENRRGWLETEASTSDGMMVVTLGEGNKTRAIAPFLLKRWSMPCRLGYASVVSFPMRVARLCGDALLAPARDDVQEDLLDAVFKAGVPYDTLLIEALRVDSPMRRLIDNSPTLRKHFWIYCPAPPAKHRLTRLPPTFAEYEAWFGGKRRAQIKSSERKLHAACGSVVQLQRVTSPQDVPAFVEAIAHLTRLTWQGRKLGKTVQSGDSQSRRIMAFAEKGWFRGYLLRCADGPIAFVIGYQSDATYHYLQIGYDPKWAEYSPGNVTLYRLIEDLYVHDQPKLVDFGGGDSQYKRVFGNEAFDEQTVYLMRRSFYTGLARITHRALFNLTGFARSALQKSGLLERARRTLRSA